MTGDSRPVRRPMPRPLVVHGSRAARIRAMPKGQLAFLGLVAAGELARTVPFFLDGDYLVAYLLAAGMLLVIASLAMDVVGAGRRLIVVTGTRLEWTSGLTRRWSVSRERVASVIFAHGGRASPRPGAWQLAVIDHDGKAIARFSARYFERESIELVIAELNVRIDEEPWPGQFKEITRIAPPVRGRWAVPVTLVAALLLLAGVAWAGAIQEFGGSSPRGAQTATGPDDLPDSIASSVLMPTEYAPPGRPTCATLARSIALSQEEHVRPARFALPVDLPLPPGAPVVQCAATAVAGGHERITVVRDSVSAYTAELTASGWSGEYGLYQRVDASSGAAEFVTVSDYSPYVVLLVPS